MSSEKKDTQNFEVRFYAGYKGRETPRAVVIGDKEFPIQEILWRRRGWDRQSGKTFETFKCRMEGDIVRITYYESGEWSLSFSEEK
jgi:hypothetical protein